MGVFCLPARVFYGSIDKDCNFSLNGAIRLMQEAAVVHSAKSGYSVMDVERTRVAWMLAQWRVRMTGSACWNDPLKVMTWPRTMERITSDRCFRITTKDGEEVAVGESRWLLVSVDSGRAIRIPEEVANAYVLNPEGVFDTPLKKLPREVGELTYSCRVLKRDIDTNNHVNNLVYLDYAREALPEEVNTEDYKEVEMQYHRQLLLGDPVHCYYTALPGGHMVQICGDDPHHLHCTVIFKK